MTRRQEFGAWCAAIGISLLAGCAAPSHKPGDEGTPPSTTSDKVDQKQVEAHAHYAQALILDMQGRPEEALEEYSKAALAKFSKLGTVVFESQGSVVYRIGV